MIGCLPATTIRFFVIQIYDSCLQTAEPPSLHNRSDAVAGMQCRNLYNLCVFTDASCWESTLSAGGATRVTNATVLQSTQVLDGSNEDGCQQNCAIYNGTVPCVAYNFNTGKSTQQSVASTYMCIFTDTEYKWSYSLFDIDVSFAH